jgi:hypothetical protein
LSALRCSNLRSNLKNVGRLLVLLFAVQDVQGQQKPALQFVTEYLRGFGAMEQVRLVEERAFRSHNVDMASTCLRSANQFQAEITLQISRLRNIDAAPAWRVLLGRVVALDERKLGIYSEITGACRSATTRDGNSVSSFEVMAAVMRYNARVDAVDDALFQTSTEVFRTLLGADSRRLSITAADKQTLLRRIQLDFGSELEDDEQTDLVRAATVIRDALRSHPAVDAP